MIVGTSKPPPVEQPPAKKPPKRMYYFFSSSFKSFILAEKTKEDKEKIQKYIQEKRHEHEKNISNEKQLKLIQEKERKNKLKKLNEQIKKVAQQPLPPSLVKKTPSIQISSKDQTEQTRERLLHLLGPKITNEPPTEYHRNTPFEQPSLLERSSSSSSSSSDSIVEIQPPKLYNFYKRFFFVYSFLYRIDQTITHSQSEPPIQNGKN
jgi:hypothetical protein